MWRCRRASSRSSRAEATSTGGRPVNRGAPSGGDTELCLYRNRGNRPRRTCQADAQKEEENQSKEGTQADKQVCRGVEHDTTQASGQTVTSTTERAVQTMSRRRQGVMGAKPKTANQLHHETHGDEQNGHSSRDGSRTPPATRTQSQTGKRRRVKNCDVEADPERDIEAYRMWISQEATDRLARQQHGLERPARSTDHEASTMLYRPLSREAGWTSSAILATQRDDAGRVRAEHPRPTTHRGVAAPTVAGGARKTGG